MLARRLCFILMHVYAVGGCAPHASSVIPMPCPAASTHRFRPATCNALNAGRKKPAATPTRRPSNPQRSAQGRYPGICVDYCRCGRRRGGAVRRCAGSGCDAPPQAWTPGGPIHASPVFRPRKRHDRAQQPLGNISQRNRSVGRAQSPVTSRRRRRRRNHADLFSHRRCRAG